MNKVALNGKQVNTNSQLGKVRMKIRTKTQDNKQCDNTSEFTRDREEGHWEKHNGRATLVNKRKKETGVVGQSRRVEVWRMLVKGTKDDLRRVVRLRRTVIREVRELIGGRSGYRGCEGSSARRNNFRAAL